MSETIVSQDLAALCFDNRFTRHLPADPEPANYRRQVQSACFSRVRPLRVSRPQLVAYAPEVAELLDLDLRTPSSDILAEVFSGNRLLDGMDPFAMCYGGHQFGNWAGQLGDGRAINLGEVLNSRGEHWMLQLKGAGPTPYSRTADGLAVLRSSVREFLCSEAMHHLGVPTTRALTLVLTGDQVLRDMFYDGNPQHEPGAVVCRVARSFTRFGSFQLFSARSDHETLQKLVQHTIRCDFPHLGEPTPEARREWFLEVCRTTAEMVVHWMRVGFVHGVMNTDNMSILGETIDYGPYGWLENFDPDWTPNTTDASGRRYRYGQQPRVAMWNLMQLARALVPVFESVDALQQGIDLFAEHFNQTSANMSLAKLGLSPQSRESDVQLLDDLPGLLQLAEIDMTIFYRRLARLPLSPSRSSEAPDRSGGHPGSDDAVLLEALSDAFYRPEQMNNEKQDRMIYWLRRYRARVAQEQLSDSERRQRMNAVNPEFVLRNYLAQLAIDRAVQNDFGMIRELMEVLRHPYDEQPGKEEFAARRPDWARDRAGCSMLSCSS